MKVIFDVPTQAKEFTSESLTSVAAGSSNIRISRLKLKRRGEGEKKVGGGKIFDKKSFVSFEEIKKMSNNNFKLITCQKFLSEAFPLRRDFFFESAKNRKNLLTGKD